MTGTVDELIPKMLKMDRDKKYELTECKEKRSKDANAYFYTLVNKLADVMTTSKDEMHDLMLKRYGQTLLVPLLPNQDPNGYFQYYEYHSKRKINGQEAVYYKVYKPSHEMDTYEMSKLIDGTVAECHEHDIETKTPQQLAELKSLWRQ